MENKAVEYDRKLEETVQEIVKAANDGQRERAIQILRRFTNGEIGESLERIVPAVINARPKGMYYPKPE